MSASLQPGPDGGSYRPRANNSARVWIDGHASLTAIFSAAARARSSLYVTVSFVDLELPLPHNGRPLLDTLVDLSERIDVRLLFWWSEYPGIGSFRGDREVIERLAAAGARLRMRWDRVPDGCHHQKSYVIDDRLAFVGGINLTREALSSPAHDSTGFHDLFVELHGPVVGDVAHNFVQRWNQASETLARGLAYPDADRAGPLPQPVPPEDREETGEILVHVQRTIRRRLYRGPAGWAGEREFDIFSGDRGIRTAVLDSIARARRSLYIENQFLMDPDTIEAIARAAERGVEVVAVVPLEPDRNLLLYPADRMRETRAALERLARVGRRFGLFGLARRDDPRSAIYVHAKLLIVDDERISIGSANLWPPSYVRDSELNVEIHDPTIAADTRRRLWKEHGAGEMPRTLADWHELGAEGRDARRRGNSMPSRIVTIDPREYYRFPEGLEAPWKDVSRARESD